MRKIVFILVTLALFVYLFFNTLLGVFIMSAPIFEFLANFDTEYTPGFSQKNYGEVNNGMSREEVLRIVGEPFWEFNDDTCFHYSKAKPVEKRIQRFGDLYLYSYQICFGKDGKVFSRDWGQIFYN